MILCVCAKESQRQRDKCRSTVFVLIVPPPLGHLFSAVSWQQLHSSPMCGGMFLLPQGGKHVSLWDLWRAVPRHLLNSSVMIPWDHLERILEWTVAAVGDFSHDPVWACQKKRSSSIGTGYWNRYMIVCYDMYVCVTLYLRDGNYTQVRIWYGPCVWQLEEQKLASLVA